ncbi:protein kinase [Streptomyces sp. NPDC017991]|uniref:serine/threonine-protein kinase n=1 Tax=Streptomyces sp. NPDC017991 TaxID=3365026 RepID=UPI00378C59C9
MTSGTPQSGVGRVIAGRYLLLSPLGSGGMGHVWLAYDQRLACEVALKEIVFRDPGEADHDRSARVARARAEARHAAGLRGHPHVVTVHDVLEHEGLPWIVMEYVAGALDLSALVARRGAVAPAECARIGLAVLDALTAGHERGVMHRDVKPANILLAPDRTGSPYARVLLTDYGISVQPDGDETRYTLTSALVGTAGYLAPERAQGGPPTATADLFSLGCTLYYAVEGYGPFDRESGLAALTAVVLEQPRPVLHAGALEPLLSAMLTKDPVRRITAEETEAALSAILTPQPHPRTQLDPGSEPPWAGGITRTAAPRTPAGPQPSGQAPGPWSGGRGFGPPPAAPGRRRRPRNRARTAVLATALGLALAGGGAWYAVANLPGDGDARPYGDAVGLSEPLADGNCVATKWTGTPFVGDPRLRVVKCLGEETYGQVMAVFEAASAQDARSAGATRCEQRTEETREKLADVRSYAAVPTSAGFETAGHRVACLLLDARGKPLFGPIGDRRPAGMRFSDTATMQKRDCLDRINDNIAELVPCRGPHQEQVLDFHRMSADTTLAQARRRAATVCREEVPPHDYGYDPDVYTGSSWVGDSAWTSGTHSVVCTAIRRDGGTMEKDEP